jgi:two-component system chemotaxis response regulator CheB
LEGVLSRHDIIVIGASAGGVEALQRFVALLPPGLAAALFVVMHIPALRPSALPKILSRSGPLPAFHARHNMVIKQGQIYVAPPDHHLILEQGHVCLGTGPKEHHLRPAADVLFRSAANVYGLQVVGMVLTGMGGDGTAGLLAVKQCGGITIVQDPNEAAWPLMPQSALKHVEVDYTVPLSSMASLLIRLIGPTQ